MDQTFDVQSVMDIIYGEESATWEHKGFVSGYEGRKAVKEGEVIQIPKEEKDYQSFTRSKGEKGEKSLTLKLKEI